MILELYLPDFKKSRYAELKETLWQPSAYDYYEFISWHQSALPVVLFNKKY